MRGLDEVLELIGAANMAGERADAARRAGHGGSGTVEGLLLAPADDDGGAFGGEGRGDGASDTAACASDHRDFIFENQPGHFFSIILEMLKPRSLSDTRQKIEKTRSLLTRHAFNHLLGFELV